VLKRESDRQALVAAALSGNPKFFLGTDSAPHARNAKESACGCAGMFTAHAAIELYAEVFDAAGSSAASRDLRANSARNSTAAEERRAHHARTARVAGAGTHCLGANELVPIAPARRSHGASPMRR